MDIVNVNVTNERRLDISINAETNLQFVEKEYGDRNVYKNFWVNGASKVAPGNPNVHSYARWILIPNGTKINITFSHGLPVDYENIDLAPAQPEPYDNENAPRPAFTKNEVVYSRDADFPGVFAETDGIKRKRGQELTLLTIYPYQYNPVQKRLTVYPDLKITVSFSGTIHPIPPNLKTKNLEYSLKSMAINGEAVLAAEVSAGTTSNGDNINYSNGCDLLIITDPAFENAANTLASWKIRKGIYTWVYNTSVTGNTFTQIENFIDNAYETWSPAPEYLLFIGDAENIPPGYILYEDENDLGTDIFYADYDDPMDYVADFGYGRLSVDNVADADSVVARIIRYERTPSTNPNYYNQILNASCFQDGENGVEGEPDELPDHYANRRFCKTSEDVRNYLMSQGFLSQREYVAYNRVNYDEIFPENWMDLNQSWSGGIFENDNPPDGGDPIPAELLKPGFPWDGSTAGISAAFNAGKFFAIFRAHGSWSGWGDPDFHSWNVDALNNGENRPFIWSITCQSGWFDNETDNASYGSSNSQECFAEHWLRHNTGGSCGILAAARNSSSGKNDRLIWGMMDAIWPGFLTWSMDPYGGPDPIYRMGDVINYGKGYMATKYPGYETTTIALFHWFGDPTSEMWTSQPNELTNALVTSPINIGTSSITVQVTPAVENMLVAICMENSDDIFGTAYTNSSGIATVNLNHSITLEDVIYVTITKHNYKPYEFEAGWNIQGIWSGSISSDWHNANNWTPNQVPDASNSVLIPNGCSNYPVIVSPVAECENLLIAQNASVTIGNTQLHVNGDLTVFGELAMTTSSSNLQVTGTVSWEDGSSANITNGSAMIVAYYDWVFKTGSNVHLDNGFVNFSGNLSQAIKCNSTDSYFNHLIIAKDENKYMYYSGSSTEDMVIKGNLFIDAGTRLRHYSDNKMILYGLFDCDGSHYFASGTFVFNGPATSFSSNTNSHFNNLEINSTGKIDFLTDVEIRGDLTINAGSLDINGHVISIEGDWTNNVGVSAFYGTNGTVVFTGDVNQYITEDETINIIELDKTGGSLIINNFDTEVTCSQFNWTQGRLEMLNGEFTAFDLTDNGIFGDYYMEGGTINLMNYDGFVDLNGDLTIMGGFFNVYGGIDDSFWSYAGNASLVMTDGILDFHDAGINVFDSPTFSFSESVSGGIIKTTGDFNCERSDFTITNCELRMYGPENAFISQVEGCQFDDVRFEKGAVDNSTSFITQSFKKESLQLKSRKKKGLNSLQNSKNGSKSNLVSAASDLQIMGTLRVSDGEFDLNGNKVTVVDDVIVSADFTMNSPDDELWVGDMLKWQSGAYGNITDGLIKFKGLWSFEDGSNVLISTGNSAIAIGTVNQNINCYDDNSGFGNLILNQQSTGKTISSAGSQPIRVTGDLTIDSDNTLNLNNDDMVVSGQVFTYISSSLIVENGGSFTAENDFDLFGSAHLIDGNITVSNDFYLNTSGNLIIDGGSFIMDRNSVEQFQVLNGYLEMNGGLLEATFNGIIFGQNTTLTMSGGEIATGWDFSAYQDNLFQPAGGAVRMIGIATASINLNETCYFHDLIIDKPVSTEADISQTILVKNDLKIGSGIFNTAGFDLMVENDVVIEPDGVLNPGNNTVTVRGDWSNNHGDAGFLENNSITVFVGNETSHIRTDETFYDLQVDKNYSPYTYLWSDSNYTVNVWRLLINTCSYRLDINSTLNVSGNLVIGEDCNLFAPSSGDSYINIQGNWINQNTSGIPWVYGFLYGTSTVTFNGIEDQFVESDNGMQDFYNLVIDKTNGDFYPLADIEIYNDLNINNGIWGMDSPGQTFSFYGDVNIASNGEFYDFTSTVNIFGSDQQSFTNLGPWTSYVGSLNIAMTSSSADNLPVFTILGKMQCSGSVNVNNGNFDLNSQTVECLENFTINEDGKVTATGQSKIAMGDGSALSVSGGELYIVGGAPPNPIVTSVSGNYEFSVLNGGLLTAANAVFQYMDASGVNIYPTGVLFDINPFNQCAFLNGEAGGTLLQINNDQDLVFNTVNFSTNTWGGTYNVTKNNNEGSINFINYLGDFSGETYENDPYNRITWGNPVPGIWTGAVSQIWNLAGNWENSLKPTATDDVYIPAGTPNDPWVSQADQECNNIIIDPGASLRIYDEILTVHGDMYVHGELKMDHVSGVLNAGDGFGDKIVWEAGSTDNITLGTINVYGDWYFNNGTSAQLGVGNVVNFYGTNRSYIYCDDDDAAFGNITINKTASPKDFVYVPANNSLRVLEDLYVFDGILDLKENSYCNVGNEFVIISGCTLNSLGTPGNEATISGFPNYCMLDIDNGATISAEYTIFEYLEGNGLSINPTATIDPLHPLNHCTFRESPAGGKLLTIANDQILTIDGATFPHNYWSGSNNVSKINDAGHITFTNVDGGFVGSNYENDPYNRVDWPGVVPGIWTGAGNSLWNVLVNWKYELRPTATDDVIIPAGTPHDPRVTLLPQECNSITVEAGASLEIYNQILNVHGDLIIHGELIMNHAGSELYAGDSFGDEISWEPGSKADVNYGTIYVYGNWNFKDGTDAQFGWGNTVVFNGGNFSTIYCDDDNATFGNLTINKPTPPKDFVTVSTNHVLRVAEDFYIGDGSLRIFENTTFTVGNELYVDDGAMLISMGTAGNNALISGTSNYCLLEIASGATISAEYTDFQFLEGQGLTINPGAIIDPLHPLNYCSFSESPAGGTLLTIENDQVVTIDGVNFPPNSWGGANNVTKSFDQGQVIFTNVQGTFVGADFENDPNDRIDWPGIVAGIWTGAVSTIWDDPANWAYHLKPDVSDDVVIPAGTAHDCWVTNADQECNSVTIESGATLVVYDKVLTVYSDIIINGQLKMDHPSGVLNAGDGFGDLVSWEPGSSAAVTAGTINVYGDWYFNNGIDAQFGSGNTVVFMGTNRSHIYWDDFDAEFGNLIVNKSASPKDYVYIAAYDSILIAEDVYIMDGVLEIGYGARFYVGNEFYVEDGGSLMAMGLPGRDIVISGWPDHCLMEIADGGKIGAQYTVFDHLGYYGLTINPGATIDPSYAFSNCTFQEGLAGGNVLTINNDQDLTIYNAHFPSNTWGGDYNVSKSASSGDINFMDASGVFRGEDYENDPNNLIHWGLRNIDLNLKVYLEGPYLPASGGLMTTELNTGGYIPLAHPYNPSLPYYDISNPADLKWLYTGTESVTSIPMNAVDWVLVQLRDATSAATATSATILETQAAFLMNDGSIVGLDGVSPIHFFLAYSNNLYVVIFHRNHLAIISNNPLVESGGLYSHDFSSSEMQALGGANGHKELEPGVWGMVSSDGNGNGLIQNTDETAVWKTDLGSSGYRGGDFNMNGLTQNTDETNYWKVNLGSGGQTPGKNNTGYESQVPD
ncbi:MAG: hypothetical protein KQI35_05505 [Bacteroidetes bacterium]|nr:hypothetical protein [Bacteroidota bacterium]